MESLLLELKKNNVGILVVDGNIELNVPLDFDDRDLIYKIESNKKSLIHFITSQQDIAVSEIPVVPDKPLYHLSSSQERLYFLYEMERNSLAYNMPQFFVVDGALDVVKLEETFKKVIDRHEILRTSIIVAHEEAYQEIVGEVRFAIEYFESDIETVEDLIQGFIRPFDLKEPPLLRVGVVKLRSGSHILMIDMHHIITDGVSQGLLIRDFMTLYNGDSLPPLRLQYKDYSEWQQSDEYQLRLSGQRSFWENEFSGDLKVLELPTDFARPLTRSYHGKTASFSLSREESVGLKYIGDSLGCTTFMTLLSVVNVLLSKLSNQEDITIGTAVAGRYHGDMENILGMFVNTLALRNHADGEKGFKDFVGDVKKKTISCFDHQWFTYEALLSSLQIARDTSRNPLFDVMFVHQNFERREISIPGLRLRPYHTSSYGVSKFDMTFIGSEQGGLLHFDVEYSTDLFTEGTIARIIGYFRHLVKEIIADPHRKLKDLEIIPDGERHQLLHEFNNTTIDYPREKTIIDLFEEQVVKTPDNVAVIIGNVTVSYEQLNNQANKIAAEIIEKSDGLNVNIALLFDSSVELVASILGTLKAGCTYVPLSPDAPAGRNDFIIRDSKANLLLIQEKLTENSSTNSLPISPENIIVCRLDQTQKYPDVVREISADNLIYIIYTSGTTGVPKGVAVKHKGVVNYILWRISNYHFQEGRNTLQPVSYHFDGYVSNLFSALLSGGGLVLLEKRMLDVVTILSVMKRERVAYGSMTPGIYGMLLNELSDAQDLECLQTIVLAGEKSSKELMETSFKKLPHVSINNEYGPTEVSVCATYLNGLDVVNTSIIGKPIANTKIYIVNTTGKLQPIGVVGELYIAGDGVAREYINNDQLTCEKFVKIPFDSGRVFKTGDLARWLADGNIEFLGRIDGQVKIRGYRVELGEIENQLTSHPAIKDVVVAVGEREGDKYLTAYYVSEHKVPYAQLNTYLSAVLPDYMLPSHYVNIDAIPLTANGKLDRKALPEVNITDEDNLVAPTSEVEALLREIWSTILKIDKQNISTQRSFFELGGNSMKILNVHRKIEQTLNLRLNIPDLFRYPTIHSLAQYLSGNGFNQEALQEEMATEVSEMTDFLSNMEDAKV